MYISVKKVSLQSEVSEECILRGYIAICPLDTGDITVNTQINKRKYQNRKNIAEFKFEGQIAIIY